MLLLAAVLATTPVVPDAHAEPTHQVASPGFVVDAPLMSEDEVPEEAPGDADESLFERNKPLAISLLITGAVAATVLTVVGVYVGAVVCCVCFVNGYYY